MSEKIIITLDEIKHLIGHRDKGFTTTKIENISGIFLPSKNIKKSRIYDEFLKDNQSYVIKEDENQKIIIYGRLLTQKHKDILECILSCSDPDNCETKFYKSNGALQIKIKPYALRKLYSSQGSETTLKWVFDKLVEISNCSIVFKNKQDNKDDFAFTIIDSVINEKESGKIVINLSASYTYILSNTILIDYNDYVKPILEFSSFCKKNVDCENQKREIHTEPIKAMIRFMLCHKGNKSNYRIQSIFNILGFEKVFSQRQLKEIEKDVNNPIIRAYLMENFGIELTNNEKTMTYEQEKAVGKTKNICKPIEQDVFEIFKN